jgi:Salmonella virulence plasmid 65kDa B protein
MNKYYYSVMAGLMICVVRPAMADSLYTSSQFAVTESGAATVSIPIQVPRGIGGIEPQLSLSYSSAAGNGLIGLGWTLSGISAITRCPKTMATDSVRGTVKFTSSDRFCLDGQRLILTSVADSDANYGKAGSTYSTERDSFSQIGAVGQFGGSSTVPNSFTAETKAGLKLEFGRTTNSQVLTKFAVGTDTINRWMLARISDRNGNYADFVYCDGTFTLDNTGCSSPAAGAGTGSSVLWYIRYTNRGATPNGTFAAVFNYELRPDRPTTYREGSRYTQTYRLIAVDTYTGFTGIAALASASRVKRYALTYETLTNSSGASTRGTLFSRLASIQEFDGTLSMSLPPVLFAYAPDSILGVNVAQTSGQAVGTPRVPLDCGGVTSGQLKLQCK